MPWIEETKIEKGMFFTVNNWKNDYEKSYIGDMFLALAVSGNFIRAKRYDFDRDDVTIDIRAAELVELSKDFVEAHLRNQAE
jgi:hypothetical protein